MKIVAKTERDDQQQNLGVRFTHLRERFNNDEVQMLNRFMLHKADKSPQTIDYSLNFFSYYYQLKNDDFHIIEPIFKHMYEIFTFLNEKFYQFDLTGISEVISMNEMNEGSEVKFHWDLSRKFKLIGLIMLSDPEEYEGGTLQFLTKTGDEFTQDLEYGLTSSYTTDVVMERGEVVVFPPFAYHAVTKVTHGMRRTLVFTMDGPGFR